MRLDLAGLAAALQVEPGSPFLQDAAVALHPSGTLLAIALRHRLALVSTPMAAPPRLVAALDATVPPETVKSLAWTVFAATAASGGGGRRRGSPRLGVAGRPPRSPAAPPASTPASPSTALNPKSTPRLEEGCLLVGTSAGYLQVHAERGRAGERGGGGGGSGGGSGCGRSGDRAPPHSARGRLLHRQRVHGGPVVSVRLRPAGAGLDTVALDDDVSLIAPDAAARLAAVEVRAVGRAAASSASSSTTAAARLPALPPLGVQRWDLARSGCGPRTDGLVLGPRLPRLRDALEGREGGGRGGGGGGGEEADGSARPSARLVLLTAGSAPALAAHDAEEHAPRGTAALVADLAASVAAGLLGAARAAVTGGEDGRGGLRAGLRAVWESARGAAGGTPAASRPPSAAGAAAATTLGGWDSSRPPSAASSRPSSGTATPTGAGGGTPLPPDKGGATTAAADEKPPPPGEPAALWRSFADAPRRVTALLPAPIGALAATADALGRVMLVDGSDGGRVLRVWKGYRGARLGWVVLGPAAAAAALAAAPSADAPALAAALAASAAADPPGSLLILAVYAPRRGVVEAWDPSTGLRLGAARVGGPAGTLVPHDAILGLGGGRGLAGGAGPRDAWLIDGDSGLVTSVCALMERGWEVGGAD